MSAAPTWDPDSLLPGGVHGETFLGTLAALEGRAEELLSAVESLPPLTAAASLAWAEALETVQQLHLEGYELWTVAYCCASTHTDDGAAARLEARVAALVSRVSRAEIPVLDALARCDSEVWDTLKGRSEWEEMRVWIEDERVTARLRLPRDEQTLVNDLAADGSDAWARLYRRRAGAVRLEVEGQPTPISPGQAWPLLHSQDAELRAHVHEAWMDAWGDERELWATLLTHIFGSRQTLADRLEVGPLEAPLASCRMTRESLDAMLAATSRARPLMARYLAARARCMGLDELHWQDQWAPVAPTPDWTWEQAESFVVDHFGAWHADLADFARDAFASRWVEAEDRSGKAHGAWCAPLPVRGESRVFMTFGGTFSGAITLAHELGHAFHNHVTRDLPLCQRRIPMTLAETASVFAENLVRDAALEAAQSREARLAMLDARLSAGSIFLLNIPARMSFELRLHELRRQGELDPGVLDAEMVRCQREAYGDTLASWDPTYWASKTHFFMASRPFYNWPYTFGYLFSSLVYARARQEGPAFHGAYCELLRRTGSEWAEPLARDVLGLDLTDPETWWGAISPLVGDLEAFEGASG